MKFTELKNDLTQGARSIYLLEGSDAYFREKAEEQIKAAFLQNPELNFSVYDGAQYKGAALTEIITAISVFPFMAEKRIIKLTDFSPSEGDYEKYVRPAFEDFPETTVLIIVNSQGKKGGVDLKRKKCVTYVDCNKSDRETVAKWVYLTLKRAGVSSSVEACEAVADYCLCDMARVSKETEKLAGYAQGNITKADVDALVYKDADFRVYQMTAAVARRDYSSFCEILYDLLTKGFDENAVLASLINYFKNLLTVLDSDVPDTELAAAMKVSDYVFGKNRQQARAIGSEALIYYINSLYSLVSRFKSGQITADGALETALCGIFFSQTPDKPI